MRAAVAEHNNSNIGSDMAVFICMYCDSKEQKEFVRWMQNIRKFDSK
jgi:Mitochondrial glycoprotein